MAIYFYQGTFLQVAIEEGRSRTVLRATCGPMAVVQRNIDETSAELLTIDKAGSVLRLLTYTCFGDSAVSHVQPPLLGFNAQRRDPFTGCYLLGNGRRVYNPVLMRFHSPDALSPFGKGGVNAYAYCEGDPVNWQDESGQGRELIRPPTKASTTEPVISVNLPIGADALTPKPSDGTKHSDSNKRKVSFSTEITTVSPILKDSKLTKPLSDLTEMQKQKVAEKRQAAEIDKSRKNLIALGKSMDTLDTLEKVLKAARKISPPEIIYDITKTETIRLEDTSI
ncbi:RHS repeat-associated core domain-containing protein [Pseudomonas sp. BW13M1]|uniref:RHS repeat-associated core domain-containing protein n=1 Tax=Pseudomonas peradeniyensis TaxID=2745488 RepID=A0A923GB31_9PSED|nr:RHS repeat-associated core domain-containing protein [Pseudomonas peradeniyensis]MBV4506838.1 RHS repeat-associated core domain-containing protein [Pseudomonas peradeniyensis]